MYAPKAMVRSPLREVDARMVEPELLGHLSMWRAEGWYDMFVAPYLLLHAIFTSLYVPEHTTGSFDMKEATYIPEG